MSKIKQACLSVLHSPALPLYLLWTAIIIAHCFFPTDRHDDAWFLQILEGDKATFENWLQFLIFRYHNWSSRSLIEGLLIIMVRFPLLWRIFDSAICILITVWFTKLVNPEHDRLKNWILVATIVLYPIAVIYEVGYVATSLNYSWPFAAALFALTPAVKEFQGREVRKREYIAALPALLLACFQELLCATLVLAFLGSFVYRVCKNKKIPLYQIGCLIICAGMLVFALTCPGNDFRVQQETVQRLPEYTDLVLLQKVELGFSSMIKTMFLDLNIFVLIFCLVLAASVWLKKPTVWKRIVSLVPFGFTLIFGTLGGVLSTFLPPVAALCESVGKLGTGLTLTSPLTWIPDLIFASILAAILVSLHFAVEDRKQYWFFFFLLVLGAASRVALGLSPTVWASGERICSFLYVTMAIVLANLLFRMIENLFENVRLNKKIKED